MTEPKKKTFRTAGYRTKKDGKDCTVFWSLDPSFGQDGSWIRQHFLFDRGSSSHLVSGTLPDRDALAKIEEIERDAAARLPLASPDFVDNQWIGSGYREALPLMYHPLREQDRREEALRSLKSRKPPKLKP
ncbi:MAG TPA: hypothetical protein VEF76_04485 [Patescibacteria group bacterium]|nr:hypothetical protein [Patescibacteria group bacterium]